MLNGILLCPLEKERYLTKQNTSSLDNCALVSHGRVRSTRFLANLVQVSLAAAECRAEFKTARIFLPISIDAPSRRLSEIAPRSISRCAPALRSSLLIRISFL